MKRCSRILIPALLLPAALCLQADSSNFVRISIKVIAKDGEPVAGAKVSLRRTDTGWKKEIVTDAKGVFLLGAVPTTKERVYEFTVTKEGYNPTVQMEDMPLVTDVMQKKIFTLLKVGEGGAAPTGVAAPVANPDDPAAKLETEARAAYNDTALPLVAANKYAEALPILDKVYKDMNEALPQIKDLAEKDELEKTVLPAVEKVYGLTLNQAGKKEEALPLLEKVIAREPKNKNVLAALVQGYAAKKDKASEAKCQALLDAETGPRADIAYNKGVEAFNKGRMREAKENLSKAIEIDPAFADAYYLMGLVDANAGNMGGVKSNFHKYLELAPGGKHAGEVKEMLASI